MHLPKPGALFPTRLPTHRKIKTQTTHQLSGLSGGLAGINQTLAIMSQLVDRYKTDPYIRETALHIIQRLPQKDFAGEARALFSYVQNNIRYVRDVNGVETVQTPVKTLEYSQGDCDDKSTLLATLLESIGCKTRFKAVGFRKNEVCHVLLEAFVNNRWLPMETTEPVSLGWTPPNPITTIYRAN